MSRARVYSGQRVDTHEGRALSTLRADTNAVHDLLRMLGYPTAPVVTTMGERWKYGVRKLTEGDDDDPQEQAHKVVG